MQTSLGKIIFLLIITTLFLNAYRFTMHVDNNKPMIGEKFTLILNFSYENLEEYEVEEPNFENFESQLLEDKEFKETNGSWQVLQRYQLTPKQAGTFTLPPLKTHIEMIEKPYQERYNRNKYLKKFDIFSKPIEMKVQPLPENITITGEYELYATVNQNSTKLGKPIHFIVGLKGKGNIPNLKFLTLNIPHVTIYEKSTTKYEKSFDILSNESFTIPPILLKYYNQTTKKVTLLSTMSFKIEVLEGKAKKESAEKLWWLLLPFIPLIPAFWFMVQLFSSNEKSGFKRQLTRCKNSHELLKKMLPYLYKNRLLTRLIYQLEEVESQDFKKLKKEILKHF
jgi:hypothetical protein